jgi:hypothetical protein
MNPRRACPREFDRVSVRVRCEGAMHTITLKPNGRLVFHNHDTLGAELDLRVAGGMPCGCRCEAVLRAWRHIPDDTNPPTVALGLPKKLIVARQSIGPREHPRPRGAELLKDWCSDSWRARMARRTIAEASEWLEGADYRRSQSSWAGGKHYARVYLRKEGLSIHGEKERVWSRNGKWSGNNSHVRAYIRDSWAVTVLGRGIPHVTDSTGKKERELFVLEAYPRMQMDDAETDESLMRPGLIVALVGKQGRGFAVNPVYALVDVREKAIVRWHSSKTALWENEDRKRESTRRIAA